MKSETIFEEFWIPVHVNHVEKLHDTLPADPKNSCQRRKTFTFTYDRSQNKRWLIVKSFWSFTVVNLKSTLSVVVERFLKLWCPANRVHFGEFSLSKANKDSIKRFLLKRFLRYLSYKSCFNEPELRHYSFSKSPVNRFEMFFLHLSNLKKFGFSFVLRERLERTSM